MHLHCNRKSHIDNCKKLGIEVFSASKDRFKTAGEHDSSGSLVVENAPGGDKYAWAVTTTHTQTNYKDFSRFMKVTMFSKLLLAEKKSSCADR